MSKLLASWAQRIAGEVRARRASRSRTPPVLAFDGHSGPARIFYLSPDPAVPRGGVRVFYRHVDELNAAGFDAAVVHNSAGFRASWFENQTRVVPAGDVRLGPQDLLVVPEFYGSNRALLPAGPRIVLFNQGAYYTFVGVDPSAAGALVAPPVEAILTISDDSLRLLSFTFEHTKVHLVRSVVDAEVFHPATDQVSRRRIAYPVNRRPAVRHELLSILAARGRLDGWELVPLSGMTESEIAETLRGCAIFLSFSELDGFGLPPAEAMACGCYVIGYHGQGGSEFFDPTYCRPIADNDVLGFARAVEEAAASYDADPTAITTAGLDASARILERYRPDALRSDLLAFYAALGVHPTR